MSDEENTDVPVLDGSGQPIEERIDQVEKGFNTLHQSQKCIVDEVVKVGDDISWFKDKWQKIRVKLRLDKVDAMKVKELANPWFYKIVLVNLLAIFIQIVLMTIVIGITGGGWSFDLILICLSSIVGPFVVGIISKFIIDDYDARLREEGKIIVELKHMQKIMELERLGERNVHENEIAALRLKHAGEIHQLELALELKKQYADLFLKEK